jgi:hypothetical protein
MNIDLIGLEYIVAASIALKMHALLHCGAQSLKEILPAHKFTMEHFTEHELLVNITEHMV